ncbi:MAG: N-acetylmuramoyl-L-alanine amidase [Steroidobacteraceae bacterium]|nr:N-acetylmuramoyl-L-alanine amidase [Steroidobacteraceae bacterium]
MSDLWARTRAFLARHRAQLLGLAAAVIAAGGAVGLTVVIVDSDHDGRPDGVNVVITVNQPGNGPAPPAAPEQVTVPKAAVEHAARVTESNLRDEAPVEARQAAPEELEAAQAQQERIRETQEPLPVAGASAGFKGCVTRFVRNQSSRAGVRPQQHWLHYTVSGNRAGWDDVNAIVAFFNSSASQASSHFVIDREGNCAYTVPIEAKAWTQAAANPIAVSYEIINSGQEASFMDTPGYDKLRSVMRQVSQRTGIPLRRGAVSGCRVTRTGIVQHKDGGICAGGHVDITPFDIDQVVRIVTADAKSDRAKDPLRLAHYPRARHLTAGERRNASCLLRQRRAERRAGSWSKAGADRLAKARACKRVLEDRRDELRRLPPRRGAHRAARAAVLDRIIRATA